MCRLRPTFAWLLLCAAVPAWAQTGYRCVDAAGRVAFQDRPCPSDSRASEFRYDKGPPPAAPAPPVEAVEAPEPASAPAAPPPRVPIAPLYACISAVDGKRYYNSDGRSQPYYVPAGIVGYPPRSLNDTARRSGVSAPELNRPGVAPPTGANALAGAYVQVQDTCRRLSDRDACDVRRQQLGDNRSRQRNAFKAERATLEAQAAALARDAAGCR